MRHEVNSLPPLPPNKPNKSDPSTSSGVYQHPTPILAAAAKSPPPVPPSKPRDTKKSEDDWEVFDPSSDDTPLKIKEYTKYQDKSSRRRSEDKLTTDHNRPVLPGKGMVLDLKQAKLKPTPKAAPRITKTSASSDDSCQSPLPSPKQKNAGQSVEKESSKPSTPVAPPRSRKPLNQKTPGTPVENIGIDDIGRKMDSLIAGLNDRLNDIDDNYVDDSQFDSMRNPLPLQPQPTATKPSNNDAKKPVPGARSTAQSAKPATPSKRPMLPTRPINSGGTPPRKASVDNALDTNNRPSKPPHGKRREKTADGESAYYDQETKKTDDIMEQVSQELEQIRKASINSQNKYKAGKSRYKVLPLKRIVQKKLSNENVLLHKSPYTSEVRIVCFLRFGNTLGRNLGILWAVVLFFIMLFYIMNFVKWICND